MSENQNEQQRPDAEEEQKTQDSFDQKRHMQNERHVGRKGGHFWPGKAD
jgi:hypothetical protein